MRTVPVLLLVSLVVLAGCNFAPTAGLDGGAETEGDVPPDPESDAVGWEDGYWHNETLAVTNEDGLNATEREKVIARSMARIEFVRDAEFDRTVSVDIISREEFRDRGRNASAAPESFRTFDNAKFEALFLIGEDRDSLAVQRANMGSNVLAFYAPANDSITLVSSDGKPRLDGEGTLAHELTHALQDESHNLSSFNNASTRDAANAENGLVEGEAQVVQQRYTSRCGEEWQCLGGDGSGSGAGPSAEFHWGVYYLNFFPYADGPDLVRQLHGQGGWDAVEAAFEDPPESSEQVIYPERYTDPDPPEGVPLTDGATNGWERLRPESPAGDHSRPDYAVFGQSAMTSAFAYTFHDQGKQPVVDPREFVNVESGKVNRSDPYDYGLEVTEGWEGDRLHVYRNPDAGTNETAYVWRIEWDSTENAREFVGGYESLLEYWGGERVDGRANTWRIPEGESGFADAFAVEREGTTVTIVNAPTVEDLDDVSPAE